MIHSDQPTCFFDDAKTIGAKAVALAFSSSIRKFMFFWLLSSQKTFVDPGSEDVQFDGNSCVCPVYRLGVQDIFSFKTRWNHIDVI